LKKLQNGAEAGGRSVLKKEGSREIAILIEG
jgi:hypothetical protein